MKKDLFSIGLVGFCFDHNSSFLRGPAEAPTLIREAFYSDSSNSWSESGVDLSQPDIFYDAADVLPQAGQAMETLIESKISELLADNLTPISLGGDHSVTYPIIKAISRKYPKLSLLHIDAHPDLYDEFEGNRYSHACPFARIMEENLVQRLVQVGIRTLNGHQRQQVERFGVEVIEMKDWRDDLTIEFETPLYISIDLDGLDPAFAPGVSHREPGGLSTRQVVNLIQRVKQKVVGADIVEYNPKMDFTNVTAMVCAKLLKEISAKILEK